MAKIVADRRINTKSIDSDLDRIKANIVDSYQYNKDNYARYNEYRKMTFETSLTDADKNLASELVRPLLEFNILEPYISRQCGEFSRQEPSFEVRESDDADNVDTQAIKIIEGNMRAILFNSNRDNMEYDIYSESLSGGFSAFEIVTEYAHEESFNQNIVIKKTPDPTLCGFDKMALESHKGDGMFCFKLFPMAKEQFEEEYGTESTGGMKFSSNLTDFCWSYSNAKSKIVLVGDYYEKKKSKVEIVQLLDGKVMTSKEYDSFISDWANNPQNVMQAPAIVKKRKTDTVTICRYRIVENKVLEYAETDYKYLPIIFVDGNSKKIRDTVNGAERFVTRPLVYHAKGIQKLKNFAGNTLANELENLANYKIVTPVEGIPPQYLDAYNNPQKAHTLPYISFDEQGRPLAPPANWMRPPCPPEITQTFTLSDQMTQSILGSYDGAAGITDDQISGKAMDSGAMQSNTAAMPYIVNFMKAWNQAALIIADLIPKYYTTPRKLAVRSVEGKDSYAQVNKEGSPDLTKIKPSALNIKVTAGVNFQIQQAKAFQTMIRLQEVNPMFAQFMAEQPGLEALLNNIDIRGIDALKAGVDAFVQKTKQQQQQMQQMQQQQVQMQMQKMQQELQAAPMALQLKQSELAHKVQNDNVENQLKAAQISVEDKGQDTDRLTALANIGQIESEQKIKEDQVQAEMARTAVNAAVNVAQTGHTHAMDVLGLHHKNVIEHAKISASKIKMNKNNEN